MNAAPTSPVSTVSRVDWVAELFSLLLALGEGVIGWLVLDALLGSADRPLPANAAIAVVATVVGATMLPRLLNLLDLWERGYRVIAAAALSVTLIILIKLVAFPGVPWGDEAWLSRAGDGLILRDADPAPGIWALIAFISIVWLRGQHRPLPELDVAYRQLRVGSALLLVGAVLGRMQGSLGADDHAVAAVAIFFAATLTAISLTRGEAGGVRLRSPAVLSLLLPALVVLIVAGLAGALFSPSLFDAAIVVLGPVFWVLGLAIRIVILSIALVVLLLVSPLLFLVSGHKLHFQSITLTSPTFVRDDNPSRVVAQANQVPDLIRYVILVLLLLFLVSGLTRFVLHRRRLRAPGEGRQPESDAVELGLARWLGTLWRRLTGGASRRPSDPLAHLRGDPAWRYTVVIRDAYGDLLRQAARSSHPRRLNQTAREHALALARLVAAPETRDDLLRLSATYQSVRYRGRPASSAEASAVTQAVDRVLTALRREA